MRLFPAEHEPWGVFSRFITYVGGIVILSCLFSAVAVNLISPGEKLPAGPARETVGAAQRASAEDEFSAANRQPTWIVPTTKYNYTPPANAKAAKKPNTIAVRKYEPSPKSRMARQPMADEASSAYGYAGSPRRANRYEQFDNMPTGSLTRPTGSLTSRQAIY